MFSAFTNRVYRMLTKATMAVVGKDMKENPEPFPSGADPPAPPTLPSCPCEERRCATSALLALRSSKFAVLVGIGSMMRFDRRPGGFR